MALGVKRPKTRRDILCAWGGRRVPRRCRISTNNQSGHLALQAVALGDCSQLGDHRRRFSKCRYLLISKGVITGGVISSVAVFVGQVLRPQRVS